ncbi:hypothetical protein D9M71_574370 [compost metagenome]
MQTRAGAVQAGVVALRPLLADLGGIASAGLPADAGEQPARLVETQRLDQLTADGAECGALQEHHPLTAQPDAAVLRGEGNGFGQLLGRRQTLGIELVGAIHDQALLPAENVPEEVSLHRSPVFTRDCICHRQGERKAG